MKETRKYKFGLVRILPDLVSLNFSTLLSLPGLFSMGKSQKKRAMRRHNPMRVPDSHLPKGLASASETSSKTEAILPIIQKMQGTDAAERKWACVAVSNLIQNDPSTRRLLQGKNIVGALITRLTDSEEEVVIEALGALRNLCIDGGYDICAEMYNKSILVPLRTFVPKVSTTLSQYLDGPQNAPENAQKLVYEFADNLITVLWCLSETSNKALAAINDMKLTPFLMSFLAAREKIPLAPVTAAAQCLYVLTDDNYPAIADVRSDGGYIACLMSILNPDENSVTMPNGKSADCPDPRVVTLRVLASGILRNVSPIPPPSAASAIDVDKDIVLPQLQPVIAAISLPDASASALQLISQQEATPNIEKLSLKNTPKSDHKSSAEIELERLEGRLRTVQLALEILTGACATLPDPEPEANVPSGQNEDGEGEGEDGDEDIAEEDGDDDELPADIDMAVDRDEGMDTDTPTTLPTLVEHLLALIQPTTLSFPPLATPSPHPPTTSALSAIHVAALECLNNIFLALARTTASSSSRSAAIADAGGRAVWHAVWAALGAVGTQTGLGQERRRAMWEVAVGVLWGVASVCRGSLDPNPEHVQALMALCDSASGSADTDAQLRVKCIGTLECLAMSMSPGPASVQANATIATYLLSMLPSPSTPVSPAGTEPMLQAAASLIDIYSDEGAPWDANFRAGGYLERLAGGVDGVKKAVRAIDRRKEGGRELRRRGEEVRDNLVAFIKYRKDLRLF
ncbi:ARM repeat-containing protein [Mycena venus]|uniref:ARM repeat-containing protein n=1 Tax=Mycena venus TaxID=2733690 RepID=A0A8H6TVZ4_9AGAR|nr:ARM repeat-containing protein [Mycena venus]